MNAYNKAMNYVLFAYRSYTTTVMVATVWDLAGALQNTPVN